MEVSLANSKRKVDHWFIIVTFTYYCLWNNLKALSGTTSWYMIYALNPSRVSDCGD